MAANTLPSVMAATSQDIEMLLASQAHVGSKNLQVHMQPVSFPWISPLLLGLLEAGTDQLLLVSLQDPSRWSERYQHRQDLVSQICSTLEPETEVSAGDWALGSEEIAARTDGD